MECKLCVHKPVCSVRGFCDIVDNCRFFLEERRWIPVTERLPEDDLPKDSKVKQIKVFVAYKTNGRWVERTQIRVKGYWYRDPDKWSWVKTSDPISHWMPLPEPPKENDHADT